MRDTSASSRAMSHLLCQVRNIPLHSRDEEQRLALRVQQTGDEKAVQALVNANLRFVVKVAYGFAGYGLPIHDLVQEGCLGLIVAVRKFEPSRGFRLISYAVWWVRAYMQNYVMHAHSLVKLGTTQAQRKLFFKLRAARERSEKRAGPYAPEPAEIVAHIAQSLRVRPEEVESMQARLCGRDASLDAPHDGPSGSSWSAQWPSASDSPEHEAEQRQARRFVRQRVERLLPKLNAKERYIVAHRLMSDEPVTLQAVGGHFDISRERARQIEAVLLRKMKQALQDYQGGRAPWGMRAGVGGSGQPNGQTPAPIASA